MRELIVTMLAVTTVLAAPQSAAANGWEAISFKLTGAGVLDTTYGDPGPDGTRTGSTRPIVTGDEIVNDVVQKQGGWLISGGYFTGEINGSRKVLIGQRMPDGRVDTSFGYLGVTTAHMAGMQHEEVIALALDNEDRILALVNAITTAGADSMYIARFTVTGALDTSFGQSGFARLTGTYGGAPRGFDLVYSAVNGINRITICGVDAAQWFVARFTGDGVIDTSFQQGGAFTPVFEEGIAALPALAVDYTGKVVVAAAGRLGRTLLMRLLPTGAVDQTYGGPDGIALWLSFGIPRALTIDIYGRVVLAGVMTGQGDGGFIARTLEDGTLDTSFNGDGSMTTRPTAMTAGFTAINVQSSAITASGWAIPNGGGGKPKFFVFRCNSYGGATSFGQRVIDFGETFVTFGSGPRSSGHFVPSGDRVVVVGGVRGTYVQN